MLIEFWICVYQVLRELDFSGGFRPQGSELSASHLASHQTLSGRRTVDVMNLLDAAAFDPVASDQLDLAATFPGVRAAGERDELIE